MNKLVPSQVNFRAMDHDRNEVVFQYLQTGVYISVFRGVS